MEQPEQPGSTEAPLITEYRWHNECVSGLLFSEKDAGRRLTTSPVRDEWWAAGVLHVRSASGAVFRLGDAAQARDARQHVIHPSALDNLHPTCLHASLLAQSGLRCMVGGVEAGGREADSILSSSLCVDDSVLHLQGPRAMARRVVLLHDSTPVAVTVVEAHSEHRVLEVVMLATDRASRLRGYGSLLVALLSCLARELSLSMLIATPDEGSRAFWLRCGWHLAAFCTPAIRTALRRLDQGGAIRGLGAEGRTGGVMAYAVSTAESNSSGACGGTDDGVGIEISSIAPALARVHRATPVGFKGAAAARARGYVELRTCVGAIGAAGADGAAGARGAVPHATLSPIEYGPRDELPAAFPRVPYAKLEAFDTGSGERGWGVRCTSRIAQGSVVVEVIGRCLSSADIDSVDDLEYVVGFDDRTMEAKARLGDMMQYIDCRTHGNVMRLINDCEEAPNLQLLYWPPPDEEAGIMPRRIFLMSMHDIPAGVELTFNYGCNYDRHWKQAAAASRPGRLPRTPPLPTGDAAHAAAAETVTVRPGDHGTAAATAADYGARTTRRMMPTSTFAGTASCPASATTGAGDVDARASAPERTGTAPRRRRPAMCAVESMQTSVHAVEKLVAVRQIRRGAAPEAPSPGAPPTREFLVRWRGYGRAADSWVAEADILDPALIADLLHREAAAHTPTHVLPPLKPPFGAQAIGRRVSLHWTAEPRKPWFSGRVAEYRPWAVPPTHLVAYDDGDQREHVLESEVAEGTLRWLDAQADAGADAPVDASADAQTAGATEAVESKEALVPTFGAPASTPRSAPQPASGEASGPHHKPALRRTKSSAQDWWLPAPLRNQMQQWRMQQDPTTPASVTMCTRDGPIRLGTCDLCLQPGVEFAAHLAAFRCSNCADAESSARDELEAQQRRRVQQRGCWQPPAWCKLPAAGFTPFLEVCGEHRHLCFASYA